MTKFYLIRHGNSMAGESIPGRLPGVSLSDDGRRQIKVLAEKLAVGSVDHICASPLERTRQSADIIAHRLNKPIEFVEDLIEIEFGAWTGKQFTELKGDPKWKQWHQFRSGARIPGGEMVIEVQARMVNQIERLRQQFSNGNVVVVSHGDPIRSIICHFAGISIDNMLKIRVDTASLTVLLIDDCWAEFMCINYTEAPPL